MACYIQAFFNCCTAALSYAYTLPDTGQTKCYDTAGTEIACAGTGQDGEYSINPMSYTDNGNGTITDNVTGLMWQKEDDNTTRTWAGAGTYCDSLTLGGHSDWRLPTMKELITIVDYSISYPGPTINTTYFPNTNTSYYWSSTPFASYTGYAWGVYFNYGHVYNDSKTYDGYVRCVRAGQSSASFTDNGNGTVTDTKTGLMWQKQDDGTARIWANALSYCNDSNLGGYSDWRLPNIKELESITDDARYYPAIDTTYFPNTKSSAYWSSTTYAYGTIIAWGVTFVNGYVYYSYKTNNYYVWPVRAGTFGNSVITPAVAVPTMTEWGMIVFMLLAGLGSIYYIRRQRRV